MANILFVTWDGGGNVLPALGIAAELHRRGETVRFLGHEQQRSMIERAALRFEAYSHARSFSNTVPVPWIRWVTSLFALINDRSLGVDLLASVQREPTDLVIIDCVLHSVLRSAEQSHVRRAVLMHSFSYIGGSSMSSDRLLDFAAAHQRDHWAVPRWVWWQRCAALTRTVARHCRQSFALPARCGRAHRDRHSRPMASRECWSV